MTFRNKMAHGLAVALGMPDDRPYRVAGVPLDKPHGEGTINVMRLKG